MDRVTGDVGMVTTAEGWASFRRQPDANHYSDCGQASSARCSVVSISWPPLYGARRDGQSECTYCKQEPFHFDPPVSGWLVEVPGRIQRTSML
jgi:hypothetical protein